MPHPLQPALIGLTAFALCWLTAGSGLGAVATSPAPAGDENEFLKAVQAVANPRQVTALDLTDWQISDAALARLNSFTALEELHLNPRLGDAALTHVRPFTFLRRLNLQDCPVTDAGLNHLTTLNSLAEIDLSGTRITDAGLTTLARLPSLKTVYLHQTSLTPEGVARFSTLRPDVRLIGAVLPTLPPPANPAARRPGTATFPTSPGSPGAPTGGTAAAPGNAEDQETFRKLNEIAKALRRHAGFKQGALPEDVDKLRAFLARAEDLIDPWGNGFMYYGEGLNQLTGPEAAPVISTDQPRSDQRWVLTLGGKAQAIPEKNFLALLTRFPNLKPQQARTSATPRPVTPVTPVTPASTPLVGEAPGTPGTPGTPGEATKLASSGSTILDQQRDRFLDLVRADDPGRITISPDGHVTELRLGGMKFTDAQLVPLRALPRLAVLDLSGSAVTDAGLSHLLPLKRLRRLSLLKTKTTYAGLQPLLQNLPGITIEHESLR